MPQPSDRPDGSAGDELMQEAMDAMERLARRLILEYPIVQRWEQPADVVQEAMIRLQRALRDVQVESRLHFFRLAAMQIRRTLIDMARRHSAQTSMAANHGTGDVAREALQR
ncbi:MAG TPA: sigma-70 family RNA polymerase sigma factor, partial [Planctomycetaceae bacterium]|nr:sigma-70 family RNA polymerase sigma factor [Planctomycetaceae bacterium]